MDFGPWTKLDRINTRLRNKCLISELLFCKTNIIQIKLIPCDLESITTAVFGKM